MDNITVTDGVLCCSVHHGSSSCAVSPVGVLTLPFTAASSSTTEDSGGAGVVAAPTVEYLLPQGRHAHAVTWNSEHQAGNRDRSGPLVMQVSVEPSKCS